MLQIAANTDITATVLFPCPKCLGITLGLASARINLADPFS